ncbi:hypothetical protein BUALT_Bualt07G0173700 [Buddleja alternifolia]|uniref:ATP synthase subunit epsilon, mitochondrial n=1 Tax=Buddleja alternifolia TaxID=168488 RepID=A0AAV6XMF3_9LAMI|nr:hypothetical protein BUALT_Bualt07G0173700 [Buddleja alternifolia]
MASNAAVPFWRNAGMTYITYTNLCANLVRQCLKEPYRSEALNREKVHFSVSQWVDGRQEKPRIGDSLMSDAESLRITGLLVLILIWFEMFDVEILACANTCNMM